jgi:hypothetical protein
LRAENPDKDPTCMPTQASPHDAPNSRRGFLTKAAAATGIAWATPVVSTVFTPASAALVSVPISVVVAGLDFVAPPLDVADLANDTAASVFSEGCVQLSSPLDVDRGGQPVAIFTGDQTAPTTIPMNTIVCSYYIRSQRTDPAPGTQAGSITFSNANIVGLSYTNGNLAGPGGTDSRLGLPGTVYTPAGPSEAGDNFFSINDLGAGTSSVSLSMFTTALGADTLRIIVTPG